MDFSHIFRASVPLYDRFASFGFEKQNGAYILKRDLAGTDFYVLLTVSGSSQPAASQMNCTSASQPAASQVNCTSASQPAASQENCTNTPPAPASKPSDSQADATGASKPPASFIADTLTAEVFERETDERYVLFDVKKSNGTFVAELREQVRSLVEEFRASCFESRNLREKYEAYVADSFECAVDYPWPDYEGDVSTAVWRCSNNKMFALVMNITYRRFGFESDEPVSVVNLKVDPDTLNSLCDGKSVFPGYHMNKKYWVSVLLTGVTRWKKLEEMTRHSYELVKVKKGGR